MLQVISHKEYKDRAQFDEALHVALEEARVNIVCLAGFMRILTGKHRSFWINWHFNGVIWLMYQLFIIVLLFVFDNLGGFVRKWEGRMLNVHPSLLPSFKGANAHKHVLEANVRISGCTVHFVAVSNFNQN